jgi:hypothetical protein
MVQAVSLNTRRRSIRATGSLKSGHAATGSAKPFTKASRLAAIRILSRFGWPGSAFRSEKLVATMLGRQGRGDRPQHLVLERAARGDDQRTQSFLAGSRDPVLDEPAEETLHHSGRRQSQGAQFGSGPGSCILHVLLPRPAETQVSQDLGAVAAPGAAKPVVVRQICDRRPDLLGQVRDRCIRKLACSPRKPPCRPIDRELRGKAEPGADRLGTQKREVLETEAPTCGQRPVHVQNACHRHRPPQLPARQSGHQWQQSIAQHVFNPVCKLAVFRPMR